MTTAPAQHISSVAAVERFISERGAALERQGTEPSVLRQVRGRIQAREANATVRTLTPLEAYLVNDIEFINAAHADPDIRGLARVWATRVDVPLRQWRKRLSERKPEEATRSWLSSKRLSSRSMTSVRPLGSHACFARASGGGPF